MEKFMVYCFLFYGYYSRQIHSGIEVSAEGTINLKTINHKLYLFSFSKMLQIPYFFFGQKPVLASLYIFFGEAGKDHTV